MLGRFIEGASENRLLETEVEANVSSSRQEQVYLALPHL